MFDDGLSQAKLNALEERIRGLEADLAVANKRKDLAKEAAKYGLILRGSEQLSYESAEMLMQGIREKVEQLDQSIRAQAAKLDTLIARQSPEPLIGRIEALMRAQQANTVRKPKRSSSKMKR